MTDRAHLYRVFTDSAGNLHTGSLTISVFLPGTTTLIPDPIYADNTTSTPLANPFTVSGGIVEFYVTTPRRVDLRVDDGGTPVVYHNIDVLDVEGGGGTWTSFTPSVTGTITNPTWSVIGSGRYILTGQTLTVHYTIGTPTSAGSGSYVFALPASHAAANINNTHYVGCGSVIQSGASPTAQLCSFRVQPGDSTFLVLLGDSTTLGSASAMTNAFLSITMEVA